MGISDSRFEISEGGVGFAELEFGFCRFPWVSGEGIFEFGISIFDWNGEGAGGEGGGGVRRWR